MTAKIIPDSIRTQVYANVREYIARVWAKQDETMAQVPASAGDPLITDWHREQAAKLVDSAVGYAIQDADDLLCESLTSQAVTWTPASSPFNVADADTETWIGISHHGTYLLQLFEVQMPDIVYLDLSTWFAGEDKWRTIYHGKYLDHGGDQTGLDCYDDGDNPEDIPGYDVMQSHIDWIKRDTVEFVNQFVDAPQDQ